MRTTEIPDLNRYDVALWLLGKIPDLNIAQATGYSTEYIGQLRKQYGIQKAPVCTRAVAIKNKHLLGTMPDQQVATQLGVSRYIVQRRRKELGISAYKRGSCLDEISHMIPLYTLTQLSQMCGLCRGAVANYVSRHGLHTAGRHNLPRGVQLALFFLWMLPCCKSGKAGRRAYYRYRNMRRLLPGEELDVLNDAK